MTHTTTLPAPLAEINLSPTNRTLDHWLVRPDSYDPFDLTAPYQRGSVWTDDQRVALIRSLIIGLPVGNVVVAQLNVTADPDAPLSRIVDGKQRIETVRAFFANEFSVPGWWFPEEALTDPDDRTIGILHNDLSPSGDRRLRNAQIAALEFDPTFEWIPNPDFDPTIAVSARLTSQDPRTRRWLTRPRSPAEALAAEAEVFLLINRGGVDQDPETIARAQDLTR